MELEHPIEVKRDEVKAIIDRLAKLTEDDARRRAIELRALFGKTSFEFAGVMYVIATNEWWREWGFDSLKGYIEEEIDMSYRRIRGLVRTWHYFVVQLNDPDIIAKLLPLGLTKCEALTGVVRRGNVDEWAVKANDLTVPELKAHVKAAVSGLPPEAEVPRYITFMLYPEQYEAVRDALDRAMEQARTEVKSHALSLIAAEYLSSNMPVRRGEPPMFLKKLEAMLGLRFIAVDRSGAVVWGEDLVSGEVTDEETDADVEK